MQSTDARLLRQQLLGEVGSFLEATLAGSGDSGPPVVLPSGATATRWDNGVLHILPAGGSSNDRLLLSAGVHGNETAPIELMNAWVEDLLQGSLVPSRSLLLVLANVEAIAAETRFIHQNMNRLFLPAPVENNMHNKEQQRAQALMAHSRRFFEGSTGACLHLDLHTAIRGSQFPQFAISPAQPGAPGRQQSFAMLGHWGIQAILKSPDTRSTFSAFTTRHCNADSFTLELGRVQPFGKNTLGDYRDFDKGVRALISATSQSGAYAKAAVPPLFRVTREVIKQQQQFRLCFDDDTENFTAFEEGTLLATDGDVEYRAQASERVVFPNANVAPGQRALLLIEPDSLPL